jgi:endonuclease YncB( thermonuclease family)
LYAGNAGQPYGEEASNFIEKKILKKKIKVKLLSKDRYGRIIGVVNYKEEGFLGTYIFT